MFNSNDILEFLKVEYIYVSAITICSFGILGFYLYTNHLYNLEINKKLFNLIDLKIYYLENLDFLLEINSPIQLSWNFLNNRYLFNYLVNLANYYPITMTTYYDTNYDNQIEILNFLKKLKSGISYEDYLKLHIKKENFYLLIKTLEKELLCMHD